MFTNKRKISFLPKNFLWRITFLNMVIIISVISLTGWAVYQTACFLVGEMGNLGIMRQNYFNRTLLQYFWIFNIVMIVIGGLLHFYFTRKMIEPIREMIESTKLVKRGHYPDPIEVESEDEISLLISHYNDMIEQIRANERNRNILISNLSHELRTPLSNIKGYLDALRNNVIDGDVELYHALYEESERLTSMIDQLEQLKEWNDVQAQTIINKQKINIADLLYQSIEIFEWKLSEKGVLYKVEAEPLEISVQVEGIQQVLSNLIDNAIRYYIGNEKIYLTGKITGKYYTISVEGPSHAIPEAEASKIFDRFYRLDASRSRKTGGSGLGLAIAKEIVEKHEGTIGVQTNHHMNKFWFKIPIINQ